MHTWIWQHPDWTAFSWHEAAVQPRLRAVRQKQGELLGRAGVLGDGDQPEQELDTLLANIVSSSSIENETLDAASVRSSLARRLGVAGTQYPVTARSEGLARIMFDAIHHRREPLSCARLCQWHEWLFPEPNTLLSHINVGALRGEAPMQVVSGRLDRPTVHFEAPPRDTLPALLDGFVDWFNHSADDATLDPLLRAAITHFWFVTLHPFDDGNGRLTRALTDMALAQTDDRSIRLYAMSVAILERRGDYYRVLEQSQRGTPDITVWVLWFLDTLEAALDASIECIDRTLGKTRFWQRFGDAGLSPEQIKVLNRLLDGGARGFENGISASQYQKVAKVSKATATRHLSDLVARGCLVKLPGGGRSTRYAAVLS
ncbi:Fic family protein [Isoalcanivorax pacificus]|uniref:Fic family protein n=1 Tax=Isoalcanivorax pacificus TaxID=1306787 RepID=UPI0003148304|nr:Fic family protein [Isoalcanivorax pacificus]